MSDIIGSLEAIRDGLKAKIEALPEVVALKRVEASILEISSVLAMINFDTPLLVKPAVAAVQVAPIVAPAPLVAPAPIVAAEVQDDEEEEAAPVQAAVSAPQGASAINEAQFEAELSKLLVHKAA
jgi:hypothetical protein